MKFLLSSTAAIALSYFFAATMVADVANADLVKMCLFYKAAGHARTDPIISQDCVSDHVHTFYGPQLFHPRTTNEDLRNSDPKFSTSVFEENQSLYWHPTIYKQGLDLATGQKTYELAEVSFSGPYYRWDRDAPPPKVEAFPKDFQMIAGNDPTLEGLNLFSECLCPRPCERADGLCESESDFFPSDACDEMGIAMAFPTCWDDSKGLGNTGDHTSHMAYTVDGTVAGACPEGYNRRLPQIQLFVRFANYEGGPYTFSDNTLPSDKEVFHADFMNGWDQDVLEDIVNNCNPLPGEDPDNYNPECTCEQFLTKKPTAFDLDSEEDLDEKEAAKICPTDVRNHIVDEEINFGVGGLPRGSCSAPLIEGVDPTFVEDCGLEYTPNNFNEEDCDGNGGSGSSEEEDESEENEDSNEDNEDSNEDSNEDENEDSNEDSNEENEDSNEDNEDSNEDSNEDQSEESEDSNEDNEDSNEDSNQDQSEENEESNEDNEDSNEDSNEDQSEEEEEDDCVDDKSFRFRGDDQKSCKWIGKKDKRINKYCPKKSEGKNVSEACPVACDACFDNENSDEDNIFDNESEDQNESNEDESEENEDSNEEEEDDCIDDKSFRYRGDDQKSCKWIGKKDKRVNKYCPKKSEGEKVFDACPVACDAC